MDGYILADPILVLILWVLVMLLFWAVINSGGKK